MHCARITTSGKVLEGSKSKLTFGRMWSLSESYEAKQSTLVEPGTILDMCSWCFYLGMETDFFNRYTGSHRAETDKAMDTSLRGIMESVALSGKSDSLGSVPGMTQRRDEWSG
jgi:hypothetical protein